MTELQELIKLLTDKGFLSFKKIVNYAFPNKEQDSPKITDKAWVKAAAWIAPVLAIIILPIIYLNPPSFFGFFPHLGALFHLVIIGYATFFTLFLLIASLILKVKNRNPTILLILTPIAPLKAFLIFGIINFIVTASGFKQTASEMFTLEPTEGQKRIKKEQLALRERHEKAAEKFKKTYTEVRTALQTLNEGAKENLDQNAGGFLEYFEKEWKDRDRRLAERRKESDEAIKRGSEELAKRREKEWEEMERDMPVRWMSRKKQPPKQPVEQAEQPIIPKTYIAKMKKNE